MTDEVTGVVLAVSGEEVWTVEDEAVYGPLRRKKLRIEARLRRDKTRLRRFGVRNRKK
jgi:hypothetical protein